MLDPEPIIAQCRAEGFSAVGVCHAAPTSREVALRAWVRDGCHGSMDWFQAQLEQRMDLASLLPGVSSVICVADRYSDGRPDAVDLDGPAVGRTARYARGLDYHRRMKRRLRRVIRSLRAKHPDAGFRACSDIEPILEREQAERAGLGRVGKHTLLIVPGQGSWVVLAEILTTLMIQPTRPVVADLADPCGSCQACIDACPTGAISPWRVDASRCLSHLHIEERGAVPRRFEGATRGWVFGCDICQEVCPHNQPTRARQVVPIHADYDGRLGTLPLQQLVTWTEVDRTAAFERGALKRVSLGMARRNAIVAAADAMIERPDESLKAAIVACTGDPDPMVREAAARAVERISFRGTREPHPAGAGPSSP